MKEREISSPIETGGGETTRLEKDEIGEITSLIGQYFILEHEKCIKDNWTVPAGIQRIEKLNELYNKLTGEEGEHFVVTAIREQIEKNQIRAE